MTNPKSRKTGRASSKEGQEERNAGAAGRMAECLEDEDAAWQEEAAENASFDEENSQALTPTDAAQGEDEDSSSSFSLQECINEFRARRIRRISTQSRELVPPPPPTPNITMGGAKLSAASNDPADADLIDQNRSNKEQERKCKPCKDGFCYCFTSDSGDGGCVAASASGAVARAGHVRHPRHRSRKSESSQVTNLMQPQRPLTKSKEKRRQSAPANLKSTSQMTPKQETSTKAITSIEERQLTAISRLETSSKDAPLIHIIQELHNNCVISEVRVNKEKIQAQQQQRSRSLNARASPRKATHFQLNNGRSMHEPTAPPAEPVSPAKARAEARLKRSSPSAPALDKIHEFVDSNYDDLAYSSSPLNTSTKSTDSGRHKHRDAGRLLQKRLSGTQILLKPRNLHQPPPKPPRSSASLEDKSISSLASTSPSVREAERVLDDFLRRRGVKVPGEKRTVVQGRNCDKSTQVYAADAGKREQRKSCPLTPLKSKSPTSKPLPSCPSLYDIEHALDTKKQPGNYEKNICQAIEKPVKELSFGWKEPKIQDMLNYDANGNRKEFKSQAAQAEPQAIGWQMPPHKIELDTVDGVERHNFAAHMEAKDTPVKSRLFSSSTHKSKSQKFIWGEQLRHLSPWAQKKRHNSGCGAGGGNRHPKSNLKSSSRKFLHSSKKKILRLVSPKKDNKDRAQFQRPPPTPMRTIGVQTSREDLRSYELSSTPQSPPGSYHSAVQTSQQSSTTLTRSQNTNEVETQTPRFDFTRTVQSPPKKAPRSSQRKLNFPLDCGGVGGCMSARDNLNSSLMKTKTYRSYHSDLDQDVTLSKMGYILSNIRAKLEASDEHAVRTFKEIERREQQSQGFDTPDSHNIRQQTRVEIHRIVQPRLYTDGEQNDPIYSEIEEDSIHIRESPNYDNKMGIQHFRAEQNPCALYATVNKAPKLASSAQQPTALGQFLHDSLKNMSISPATSSLPPLPEPPSSEISYTSPADDTSAYPTPVLQRTKPQVAAKLAHCQSLNNIRVREQHSPPKKNRNLSKSDLSLHRSEIFLENLCRGEIIVEHGELERLEKVNNHNSKCCHSMQPDSAQLNDSFVYSRIPEDSVSYELPNDADLDSHTAGSQLGLSIISPPHAQNQSTPKKPGSPSQTFLTKLCESNIEKPNGTPDLNVDVSNRLPLHNQSTSCPTTPRQLPATPDEAPHAASLNEICSCVGENVKTLHYSANNNNNTLSHYQRIKNVLRKSLRKSKNFVKSETKRLSNSLNLPTTNAGYAFASSSHNQSDVQTCSIGSSFNLDMLFALDEEAPVSQQLAKAVSICRQLPDLEISPEMVEAERLLLFSTLRREAKKQKLALVQTAGSAKQAQYTRRFFVDDMRLPIKADTSQDLFFNYFYIVAFECGGIIKSTQSVECRNREAIFSHCGIEFSCDAQEPEHGAEVRCEVFMLRLRKVSTLSLEPRKPIVKVPKLVSLNHSNSSSCEDIVSRFRLHASFTIKAIDFAPYEYVAAETKSCDKICLRAARTCSIPLTSRTSSTNLSKDISLSGRAEVRLSKCAYSGFLNVQDPHSLHNWNRRWCTLDGLHMSIWQDVNEMQKQPLFSLNLCDNIQSAPLAPAPRELCARPRSFCLQCTILKADEEVDMAAVFFAAETQLDLSAWLQHLNDAVDLTAAWM